jgi:hypothetical protein
MADTKKDAPKAPPPATSEGTVEKSATAMKPTDLVRPDDHPFEEEPEASGRLHAREGLKPIGNELPHPSAAARPGKSSGMAGVPAEAPFSDDDDPEDLSDADKNRAEVAKARTERRNGIQVEATALGYYDDTRRRPGEVFFIWHPDDFARQWMRRTDGKKRVSKPKTGNEALQEQHEAIRGRARAVKDDNPLDA